MKRTLTSIILGLSLLTAPVAIVGLSTGCTMGQKTIAFNTLAAIETTVDASMKSYAAMVVQGKITEAMQASVRDTYARYQIAFAAAVAAARGDLTTLAPANVQSLANDLIAILKAAGVKI